MRARAVTPRTRGGVTRGGAVRRSTPARAVTTKASVNIADNVTQLVGNTPMVYLNKTSEVRRGDRGETRDYGTVL